MSRSTGRSRMGRHRPAPPETLDVQEAYAAHGAELYRFALRQLGDGGAAQDVVQEVFLRAWRASGSFDPHLASLRTWLFAIARNVVVDEARRFAVRPWQRQLTDDAAQDAPAVAPADEHLAAVWVVRGARRRARGRRARAVTHKSE